MSISGDQVDSDATEDSYEAYRRQKSSRCRPIASEQDDDYIELQMYGQYEET